MAQETGLGVGDAQALGTLEELHHSLVAVDLQDFSGTQFAVGLFNLHQFVVFDALNALDEHQRADDLPDGFVFLTHGQPLLPSER